ncbi:unnamed protein product [Orchesella dallaii]|uniref:Uncharacterized protein n=1 Tax=Orchesella dallaii TaxID=48710 RepID=A0ABP1REH5_9HEXA
MGLIFPLSDGPDMHLYKTNEKIGWSSMISVSALQNPTNRLVTNDALRFRLRTKLYPNGKAEEETPGPSEKQRILWEISDVASKLKQEIDEDQAFVDLHISKEFVAGHYWGGNTRWKSSLLMREIHHQNYLGINMELLHVDQNWRELVASYNVTLLDAHDRIVKEFSIASNDFKAVSARHSYFMLVKDVLEVLERGDKLTIKIFFDLQARKRSFDVEFIRT